ncbi:putative reverse transcriptase domain-containing protein [Tanacetum coccineum]
MANIRGLEKTPFEQRDDGEIYLLGSYLRVPSIDGMYYESERLCIGLSRKPSGISSEPEILSGNGKDNNGLCSQSCLKVAVGHDTIGVVVDRFDQTRTWLCEVSIILDLWFDSTYTYGKLFNEALGYQTRTWSTAYHPETDGQSERTIQTLEAVICSKLVLWIFGRQLGF